MLTSRRVDDARESLRISAKNFQTHPSTFLRDFSFENFDRVSLITAIAPPHSVCRNNRQKDSYLRAALVKRVGLADIGSHLPRVSGITDASLFEQINAYQPEKRRPYATCAQSLCHRDYYWAAYWKALSLSASYSDGRCRLSSRCMTIGVTLMIRISRA